MSMSKVVKILKSLKALEILHGGGDGFILSQIIELSKLSRSTVWRYLVKLERVGVVDVVIADYKGKPASHYVMTTKGYELLASAKELI